MSGRSEAPRRSQHTVRMLVAHAYELLAELRPRSLKTVGKVPKRSAPPLRTRTQGLAFCLYSLRTRTNCAKAVRARSRSAGQGQGELKAFSREPSLRTVRKGCLRTRHKSRACARKILLAYVINIPEGGGWSGGQQAQAGWGGGQCGKGQG